MLLIAERAKRRDDGRGLVKVGWGAMQTCGHCGAVFNAHGYHKWHTAECRRAIKGKELALNKCKWCGDTLGESYRRKHKSYCAGKPCAQRGITYGTPERMESMANEVYQSMIVGGDWTARGVAGRLGISPNSVWVLLERRCGPSARQWVKDMRCTINPSGFKGAGRPKPETLKDKLEKRWSEDRMAASVGLRMWRLGAPNSDISSAIGCTEGSVPGFLAARSGAYRSRSQRRINRSKWRKNEQARKYSSRAYPVESVFRDHVAELLGSGGYSVDVERPVVDGSKQRVDVMAEIMGSRFALEAKVTARSSRADQCLGQALRKSANLNAVPVVVFPSDVLASVEFIEGLAALVARGIEVRLCSEADACDVLAMGSDAWVDHCGSGRLLRDWTGISTSARQAIKAASESRMTCDPCPTCGKAFRRYRSLNRVCCSRKCSDAKI